MSTQSCIKCGAEDKLTATMCSACGTPFPVPDPSEESQIHKGQLIAKRYVILDRIGQGGMGCIYKVQDNTLGEVVALKTLLPEYVQDKIVVERFFNEARIARGLSHPHIVRVHDIGTADGIVYISMELLPGRTLRSMLDKMITGRQIPLNAILRMFDALCAALEYAHSYTVHRDIKPENVMVLPDGTVKLMDFGISKLMSSPNMTSASMVMGTPHYMSPEQLKNSADVDGRADIYSVGVMLYESLTGAVPTGIGQRSAIQTKIPPALSPIVQKCCQNDPLQRYQKISELRAALRSVRLHLETGFNTGDPSSSTTPTFSGDAIIKPSLKIGRKLTAMAGVAAVAISAFLAWPWANERQMMMLEEAVAEANNPTTSVDPNTPEPDSFSQMRQIIQKAKGKANKQADSPRKAELLEQANTLWANAVNLDQPEEAMAEGWAALHRYLALAYWPSGMDFIPEGKVYFKSNGQSLNATLPAFFIDLHEITVGQFKSFSDHEGWRVHPDAKSLQAFDTMGFVTYYDATAYLNTRIPFKQLPTEAQLTHAITTTKDRILNYKPPPPPAPEDDSEEDSLDDEFQELPMVHPTWVLGNFYEWTRMENTAATPEELITTSASIMSANIHQESYTLGPSNTASYLDYQRNIGFRGVVEMPTTLAQAQAWISN